MNSLNDLNSRKIEDIINIIKKVSDNGILEKAYISLSKKLMEDLSKIDSSLFDKGKINSWACGIIHALGLVNGLFDKKTENMLR